jgi:hypothetical protein
MIVTYKGPDTNNRKVSLQGKHEKSETDDFDDALEDQKVNGFISKFWYFTKGTNGKGFKTKDI